MEINLDEINKDELKYTFTAKDLNSFAKYRPISEQPSSIKDISFSVKDEDKLKLLETLMFNFNSEILKNVFGFSNYRYGQKEIVENILSKKQTLAIMPTGAGKSLCYQLPAVISKKKTIVIAPLIALIEDQVSSLKECGVNVEQLHSNQSRDELTSSWNNFKNGKSNIIYISPERLMTDHMINNLKSFEIGLFVIDEIHCVSKWGQSFRPDYEKLSKLKKIFPNSNIVGFTATADKTTRLDIINKIFDNDPKVFIKGFDRPNLSLSVYQKTNWKLQIIDFLNSRKGQSGIIYCLSRKKTEEVSSFLIEKGFYASAYHAGLDASVRKNVQNINLIFFIYKMERAQLENTSNNSHKQVGEVVLNRLLRMLCFTQKDP